MKQINRLIKILALLFLTQIRAWSQTNMPDATAVSGSTFIPNLPANITGSIIVNSLKTIEPFVPIGSDAELNNLAPLYANCKVRTDYFDGLGRELQTVVKGMTNGNKDWVQHHIYDAFGREATLLLPFVKATNPGSFCKNIQTELLSTYAALGYTNEQFLYKSVLLEASPLNTLKKTWAEGSSWNGNAKGVGVELAANTNGDNIKLWTISTATNLPVTSSSYPGGSLWIKTTIDEDELTTKEYLNMEGKKVMSAQVNTTNAALSLNTYYVYDDLGRLRYILPPKAVQAIESNLWTVTSTVLDHLGFSYEYDDLGRVIKSKNPGVGFSYMVYNRKDELVMVQNPMQRLENQWQFNKQDIAGRLVQTGIYTTTASHAALQAYENTQLISIAFLDYIFNKEIKDQSDYINTFTDVLVYLTNYYDHYNFTSIAFDQSNASIAEGYDINKGSNTRGLLTGVKALISDNFTNPSDINYNLLVHFYNARSELIQQHKQYFGTQTAITYHGYDFAGRKKSTVMKQNNAQTIYKKYTYDYYNRLLTVKHKLNNAANYTQLASYSYDGLGRLNIKKLGNMQYPLNYQYNIRGWLTGINKNYCTNKTGDHFFGMEINYENGYEKNYLNGRVSGIKWRNKGSSTQQRTYGYTYDFASRLILGDYYQKTEQTGTPAPTWSKTLKDYTTSNMNYDANGNILSMKHMGVIAGSKIILDDLTYTYDPNTNILRNVTESTASQSKDKSVHDNLADFRDMSNTNDYTYDAGGSLISDGNRGIGMISNNWFVLNKPMKVDAGSGNMIEYTYDASGTLLKKKITQVINSINKVAEYWYLDEITYKDGVLNLIEHEEGRYRPVVAPNTCGYEYYIKDYIGNIRSIIGETQSQGVGTSTGTNPISSGNTGGPATGAGTTGPNNGISGADIKTCDSCQITYADTSYIGTPTMYLATSEVPNAILENQLFDNVDETRDLKPLTSDSTDVRDAKLNASLGSVVGPGLLLKVSAGDKIEIGAEAFYYSNTAPDNPIPVSDLISSIISSLSGMVSSIEGGIVASTSNINVVSLTNSITQLQNNTNDTLTPKGYLNYIIFDENMNFLPEASGAIKVFQANTWTDLSVNAFKVPVNGFIYVFTSNTSSITIRTDNLFVLHWQGQLLEEFHYYPYGLFFEAYKAAGILTSSNYKHNSQHIQQNEFSDGSNTYGLDWYDFEARTYDPQIGRFMQIDPLAPNAPNWSPYRYCFDNPVNLTDPDGRNETDFQDKDGNLIEHVEDGSNAVFQQTGKGVDLHYEFKKYNDQGGKDEINDKVITSVIQMQQELNLSNAALQPGAGGTTSHCNQATACITKAVGSALAQNIYIPGKANEVAVQIESNSNYKNVNMAAALKAATNGKLVIAAYINPKAGRSGHLATLTVGRNISKGILANIGYSKGVTNFVNPTGTKEKSWNDAAFKAKDWNNNVKFYILAAPIIR
ncbi:MAG: DUF6443 domain-containing protein [Bacteroidota bacterium]|nr:DUF6443 domain-containing protein [Bacteroidota bacterium]